MCRSHRRASNQFSYSLYGNPIGFTETSMIKRPDGATLELPMRPRLCAGARYAIWLWSHLSGHVFGGSHPSFLVGA